MEDRVVYRDERYALGMDEDRPYLRANDKKFFLSCHPFEPCLYITAEDGSKTAVHNAFDPYYVLEAFQNGETVASITGFEYDARAFCMMVEYAADMLDIQIDEAEKVFGDRAENKRGEPKKEKEAASGEPPASPETGRIIRSDPFFEIIDDYPDSVIEFRLVKVEHTEGFDAHFAALARACRDLFGRGYEEDDWHYDCGRAKGKRVETAVLFEETPDDRGGSFREAFRYPPHGVQYSDKDFDRVNAALFPMGKDALEVYEWSTDWSEFLNAGRARWGALCLTVYDKKLDRFAVIMASSAG